MHVGIAHHFGWAVVVAVSDELVVVDRRRIELVEPGVAVAPIHSDGKQLDDDAVATLVAETRSSAIRSTDSALDDLVAGLPEPVRSLSLRWWDPDFPDDLETRRRSPFEARADSVMYREVLADAARQRGWDLHLFVANDIEAQALDVLGERTDQVLRGPRATFGAPWGKDHRIAFAAAVVAASR
jgi:hypothetical protein